MALPNASYFPAFLNLAGRRVLLVGGGSVATAKIGGLLEAGARVTVVAPDISAAIAQVAELTPLLHLERRAFVPADLAEAWFVVSAAPAAVNRAVAAAAEGQRVFVLAVDDVPAATAIGAGVLRRGGVTIAVSTEGRAPALAGLIREGLDALVPEEIGEWVETARAQRAGWKAAGIPLARRRPLLLEALTRLYPGNRSAIPASGPADAEPATDRGTDAEAVADAALAADRPHRRRSERLEAVGAGADR